MFNQIPQTRNKALTTKKGPETYDRHWWWMEYGKYAKGPPPLNISKLSKNHKRSRMKKHLKIISGEMIGN